MSMKLRDFTVDAGRHRLLSIDTLDLPSSGLVAVIGPNGAGKSTLLRAMAGVIPHRGIRQLDGTWPAPDRIGFMPQDFNVSAALSVAECVLLGLREQLGWRVSPQDRAEVARALARLDLSDLAEVRMDRLSGGQQQRVLLAQRLIRNPRLLILDEPTSALDLHHQLEVLDHLRVLSSDTLVIAALHDLTLAARFADHVVLLDRGGVATFGETGAVMSTTCLDAAYRIDSEILSDRSHASVIVAHRAVRT